MSEFEVTKSLDIHGIAAGELLVIVEFCRYGNIRDYLLSNRQTFINDIDDSDNQEGCFQKYVDFFQLVNFNLIAELKLTELRNDFYITIFSCAFRKNVSTPQMSNIEDVDGYLKLYSVENESLNHNSSTTICAHNLIDWAFQISCGMNYLVKRRVRITSFILFSQKVTIIVSQNLGFAR